MGKYILAPCVEEELWSIWTYIAKDNPDAATRVVEAAYESFRAIAATPRIGRPRSFRNTRIRDVRSWRVSGFPNYLIFYRVVAEEVQVLHIYHGAQDLEQLFEKEESA